MKNFFFAAACFSILTSTILAQNKQSDRDFAGLKGNVKSVLTERADATLKAGKIVESNRRKVEGSIFQSDGSSLTQTIFHWETGEVFETNTYLRIDDDKAVITKMEPAAITATITGAPSPDAKPADPRWWAGRPPNTRRARRRARIDRFAAPPSRAGPAARATDSRAYRAYRQHESGDHD